ncbi:hypothetical protein IH982_01110 [Patescibacteria group bacterium]|nr:hypothetical protein [Patescibacteria group bacterium]
MIAFATKPPVKGAVLLGVFLAGLLLLYIFQVNALTASVYHMGDQEKRLRQLKEQSILFKVQHLPSFSRARMEELAQEMHFERVQEVSYLRVLGPAVAATTNQE